MHTPGSQKRNGCVQNVCYLKRFLSLATRLASSCCKRRSRSSWSRRRLSSSRAARSFCICRSRSRSSCHRQLTHTLSSFSVCTHYSQHNAARFDYICTKQQIQSKLYGNFHFKVVLLLYVVRCARPAVTMFSMDWL